MFKLSGISVIKTNQDFLKMMRYCRSIGVAPNFTTTGIDASDAWIQEAAGVIGAVAVSVGERKDEGYNAIKSFAGAGIKQVNAHLLLSKQTLPLIYRFINDIKTDVRLTKLNAVVFLTVKPKGRAKDNYHNVSTDEFDELIKVCFDKKLSIGFDSCSAPMFSRFVCGSYMSSSEKKSLLLCTESCEADLFSTYINVKGELHHCSFAEGERPPCVNVSECSDFIDDVWNSDNVLEFRKLLISNKRECPLFCLGESK